ncbi:MAG: hypothetical protein AAF489_17145 [Bacteroidota bacterium]
MENVLDKEILEKSPLPKRIVVLRALGFLMMVPSLVVTCFCGYNVIRIKLQGEAVSEFDALIYYPLLHFTWIGLLVFILGLLVLLKSWRKPYRA